MQLPVDGNLYHHRVLIGIYASESSLRKWPTPLRAFIPLHWCRSAAFVRPRVGFPRRCFSQSLLITSKMTATETERIWTELEPTDVKQNMFDGLYSVCEGGGKAGKATLPSHPITVCAYRIAQLHFFWEVHGVGSTRRHESAFSLLLQFPLLPAGGRGCPETACSSAGGGTCESGSIDTVYPC